MSLIILLPLCFILFAAVLFTARLLRARNRRAFMTAPGVEGVLQEGPGISLLADGIRSDEQIARLLCVEYARYEVIAAIDGRREPELFSRLLNRYRMIGVERIATKIPGCEIRGIYRSRNRAFRRLVLIDCTGPDAEARFDAAAQAAAYDLLLPLRSGLVLRSEAIERLAAEYCSEPGEEPEMVHTVIGPRVELIARERVNAAGGFACHPAKGIPRNRRRTLWEPLAVDAGSTPGTCRLLRDTSRTAAIVLLLATTTAAATGLWPLVAVLLTAALAWVAASYALSLASAPQR